MSALKAQEGVIEMMVRLLFYNKDMTNLEDVREFDVQKVISTTDWDGKQMKDATFALGKLLEHVAAGKKVLAEPVELAPGE